MASSTLNFSRDNLITGVNVIEGNLHWTDDRNEPRQLNIETFKAADHSSGTTSIHGRSFEGSDITVIRPHPFQGISMSTTAATAIVDRPFRNIFPRFSYRWRYADNQYSPFAPFTQVAFAAGGTPNVAFNNVVFSAYNEQASYEEGVNSNMFNRVTSVTLMQIPVGGPDVIEVDILYTESISSTIYNIRTVVPTATERTAGVLGDIIVNSVSLTGALPANQLTRHFDNVPRLAKSQEITANRLIYANYLQNYDQPDTVALSAGFAVRSGSAFSGMSVKTNRTYELGIAFIDEFGRQGGLLTNDSATVTTPFFTNNRLNLNAQIDATTTPPPSWARKYRYFVKDASNEHLNLVSSISYFDTSDSVATPSNVNTTYIWLGFNSRDRNKITEETVLQPKRHTQGNTTGVSFEGVSLHPIIEISNELPEVLLLQAETTAGASTDEERLAARQSALAIAQGQFFVKVKRATDEGSGGGSFLSTGESNYQSTTSTGSTTSSATYSVFFFPLGSVILNYVDVITGNAQQTTLYTGTSSIQSRTRPTVDSSSFITADQVTITQTNTVTNVPTAFTGQLNQTWFETVPIGRSELDLYWESSETFTISDGDDNDYGELNLLSWTNCYAFIDPIFGGDEGIFIESVRMGDEFNNVLLDKGVRVNTPQENYREDRRQTGLIYSGLFNDRTNINRLNEFIQADGITKEIEPNYGSIQKLYTRDTNLIVFTEDKTFGIQSDKDQLFNADGTSNVSTSNVVLGQTQPYGPEFGIGKNPESFSFYGSNIYFVDAGRGVVIQFTPNNGQMFEISKIGLNDFFRDRLSTVQTIVGGFDDYSDKYIVSLQSYDPTSSAITGDSITTEDINAIAENRRANQTLGYEISTQGWPSRMSFTPEGILTLNNRLYTWDSGRLYLHNDPTVDRNNFYGTQYDSSIRLLLNDNPSTVKLFKTLEYEGTPNWSASTITTDSDTTINATGFIEKEDKFYTPLIVDKNNYIIGTGPDQITDGDFTLIPDGTTRQQAGERGFYLDVTLENSQTTMQELFSVGSNDFISSQ